MANTTNFGWETPDDTDLVKDGAAAMRTLGNSIDASFVDLKGGTTGQILSKNSNTDLDYVWINNDQGDITAVTAGTGISGGGTSGAVTITNSMATEITASGDIIVGTGSGTFDNLPIGTTGQVLTADTTVSPYKVKWAAVPATTPTYVGVNALRTNVSTSLTEGAIYKIAFTSEEFDTDGFHDNSTNNTRITIPSGKGGKYLINAYGVNAIGTAGLYAGFYLYKNGSTITAGGAREGYYARFNPQNSVSSPNNVVTFSAVVPLVAGDYIELGWIAAATETTNMYYYFQATFLGA